MKGSKKRAPNVFSEYQPFGMQIISSSFLRQRTEDSGELRDIECLLPSLFEARQRKFEKAHGLTFVCRSFAKGGIFGRHED